MDIDIRDKIDLKEGLFLLSIKTRSSILGDRKIQLRSWRTATCRDQHGGLFGPQRRACTCVKPRLPALPTLAVPSDHFWIDGNTEFLRQYLCLRRLAWFTGRGPPFLPIYLRGPCGRRREEKRRQRLIMSLSEGPSARRKTGLALVHPQSGIVLPHRNACCEVIGVRR